MAGVKRPYFLTDSVTLTASGTGELTLRPGANERFEGHKISFVKGGTFSITGIKNDSGTPYTNADSEDPITSTMLPTVITDFHNPIELAAPLVIEKNDALTFQLTDTSAASNTVRVMIEGTMESLETK